MIGRGRALLDDHGIDAEAVEQQAHRQPDRPAADDQHGCPTQALGGIAHGVSSFFPAGGSLQSFYLTRTCLICSRSRFEMEQDAMDLRQLRYFVAVAERGGFSAAASTLNVAQSALSRHIKLLEHELGGPLLERGARGIAVTESGKVLLARGRWLLGALDDIKAEVLTENREPGGTVRLGAPSTLADNFYSPLAQLFARRFPRVRLELSEGLTEEMSDRLLKGELDLAIVTAPQPNDHLDYETLVVEQVFLIGPPHDKLLSRGILTRKDFQQLPAAVLPLSRSVFPLGVRSSLRVENMTPLKQMVAAGLGYGLLPFSGIHQEVAAGTLAAALLPWLHANRVLALPRGRPVSRATREAVAGLKEVCSDLIDKGKILTVAPSRRQAASAQRLS
jgi:LysR family nitrogen assimilation transcriptional regulator